jgi:hypothetical protein
MPRHKSLGSFQLCPVLNNYIYENETLPLLRLDYDLVLCQQNRVGQRFE